MLFMLLSIYWVRLKLVNMNSIIYWLTDFLIINNWTRQEQILVIILSYAIIIEKATKLV